MKKRGEKVYTARGNLLCKEEKGTPREKSDPPLNKRFKERLSIGVAPFGEASWQEGKERKNNGILTPIGENPNPTSWL